MSANHAANGRPIPAAAYYRMSTDRQEDSIGRQKSQVAAYAACHGFEIVREYADEGIAGDEVERRKAFRRLLADAEAGHFRAILCDDKDRFGRFDSIDYGYYVKPLRDRGIWMETASKGKIDWHSFAGRIADTVQQEAKQIEAQAIGRRVLTDLMVRARKGKFLGSPVPYGMRLRIETDERGHRVKGTSLLEPGPEREVEVVRLIFRLYGEQGFSVGDIVNELHRRGVASPEGREWWHKSTLTYLLRNRCYVGDARWNGGSKSKYAELVGGKVESYDRRPKSFRPHEPADFIIAPDAHRGLVERDLFEKVQWRLAANLPEPNPNGPAKRKAGRKRRRPGDPQPAPRRRYALTGLLICGHCGARMQAFTSKGHAHFRCSTYCNVGTQACNSNIIREAFVLDRLLRSIRQTVLNPEGLAALREELRRQQEGSARDRPAKLESLRRRVAELDRKIGGMMDRLADIEAADRSEVPHVLAKIRDWRGQREQVLAEIQETEKPAQEADLEEAVRAAEAQLFRLEEVIGGGDVRLVRLLLSELVDRIELYFTSERRGKLLRCKFSYGLIHLRQQTAVVASKTQGRL
jgi:DNA invertase Pin-like site-specific DNA recombinase